MIMNKAYLLISPVISLGLLFGTTAHADEADQETNITFSAPVEIPGHVLPAGTYMFKLAEDGSETNIVQIFNSDGTKLYAMLPTFDADRSEAPNGTTVTLAQQGSGTPDALLKWFYPGSETGHEFIYSAGEEKQLAHDRQEMITANPKG
jgi:hypothetical protein